MTIDDTKKLLSQIEWVFEASLKKTLEAKLSKLQPADEVDSPNKWASAVASSINSANVVPLTRALTKPHLVLIATPIGLLGDEPAIADINAQGGIYHQGKLKTDGTLDLGIATLDNKVHFVHFNKLSLTQIESLTANGQFDGIIVGPEELSPNVNVKYGTRIGAGVNNMNIGDALVMNTPGVNAKGTAQWVKEAMLDSLGGLSLQTISAQVAAGALRTNSQDFPKLYKRELTGKSLAIIGSGNIAQQVIESALADHMKITVWSPNLHDTKNADKKRDLEEKGVICAKTKEDALRGAEFASVHVPLVESGAGKTADLIGAEEISLLADKAVLLNFARPGVTNPDAVANAIKSGKLKKAYIDGDLFQDQATGKDYGPAAPFVSKLAELGNKADNLVILPHVGGDTTHEARETGVKQAVTQTISLALSHEIINRVKGKIPPGYVAIDPKAPEKVRQI